MTSEEKWVYTQWGYGKLIEQHSNKSVLSMTWGGLLYTSPDSTSSSITIQIKPFTQTRSLLDFTWDIKKDFSTLFKQIHKTLNLKPHFQVNLYLPRGKLIHLTSLDSPLSLKLKCCSKLVATAQQCFTWDAKQKSPRLDLFEDLITVRKREESDIHFDTVKGTLDISSGSHEWEVKIDFMVQYEEEEEIIIGVATKPFSVEASPTEGDFWGIMCLSCRKICSGVNEEYGERVNTGDIILVRLDYKENKGTLTFFRNGVSLGVAFAEVPVGVVPAVCLNYPRFQISLGKVKGV